MEKSLGDQIATYQDTDVFGEEEGHAVRHF